MYNNKFVTVVKVNGKILKELDGVVYIPFGSEYEIAFKNLHTTRAKVSVSIDDQDVLDGRSLVIDPNGNSSIEGFMKGNSVSHKFKFIEKTQEISDYRGDKISDGLIRVSFKYERPKPQSIFCSSNPGPWGCSTYKQGIVGGYSNNALYSSNDVYSAQASMGDVVNVKSLSDAGITVKGSSSSQEFSTTSMGEMESVEHSMVIQLKGALGGEVVETPILVKTKVKCDTCGRVSFAGTNFCGNCGTSLVI